MTRPSDPNDPRGARPPKGPHLPPPPAPSGSLIDPMLALELAAARPDEPVAALILVRGDVREALAAGRTGGGAPLPSELGRLVVRVAGGEAPPKGSVVELFPELGALYVAAPAEELARLLADPDVASATVPDNGP